MLKIKVTAFAATVAFFVGMLTTPLMAGSFGVGIAGFGIATETNGSETLKDSGVVTKKDGVNGAGFMAAGYVQYTFGDDRSNGFVIGVEKIPGSASIGSNIVENRDDNCEGLRTLCTRVSQVAKAKISNHMGAYVETPSLGGLYLKVGYSEVDLTTEENLDTGATYGDATLDGFTYGVGFKGTSDSGIHVKFAVEYTDYGSVSLTSSAAASPDNGTSTIKADTEAVQARLSIGYNF